MEAIQSVPELYAHAIAIEREAAARYAELAQRMGDLGNDAVAEVFANLASFEASHLEALERRAEKLELPEVVPEEVRWLQPPPAGSAAKEAADRVMSPRQALQIALGAEKRAQAFFERALMTAHEPAVRSLAGEMALEELEHVELVERMLEASPEAQGSEPAIEES